MKIAKTGAALGLAAATLVAGLGLGPAASAASTPLSAPITRLNGTDTLEVGKASSTGGWETAWVAHPNVTDANETGRGFTMPAIGATGLVKDVYGNCLTAPGLDEGALSIYECDTIPKGWITQFTPTADGHLTSAGGGKLATSNYIYMTTSGGGTTLGGQHFGLPFTAAVTSVDSGRRTAVLSGKAVPGSTIKVTGGADVTTPDNGTWSTTVTNLPPGANTITVSEYVGTSEKQQQTLIANVDDVFSAYVDSVDLHGRSAELSGFAHPGAAVIVNGREQAIADAATGAWSHTISNLGLGANVIALQQFENGTETASTSVVADLSVAPVRGVVSFPTDLGMSAVASGTAEPGATVVIRDVTGNEITRTTASTGAGTWSVEIPAPNRGGDYDIRLHQEIDGEADGDTLTTIAYGAAVTISAPVEGMAHDGGPVTMNGTGERGANVVIREQGKQTVLGIETVLENGTWNLKTTNVDDRRHVLEATQTGRGHNVTTTTVTLNPEKNEAEFALTNPDAAQLAAGYTPNAPFTFRGTGKPNSTITIENLKGLRLGTATVDAQGTWAFTRSNMGTYDWTMNFIQDKGTPGAETVTMTGFKPGALVAITNPTPAQIAQGYTPNTAYTFGGTGTPGKTITVKNLKGLILGTTTVAENGTWAWTRSNMGTYVWSLDFVQDAGTPGEATAPVRDFAPKA